MNSLGPECDELKKTYDSCFNVWFTEKFLKVPWLFYVTFVIHFKFIFHSRFFVSHISALFPPLCHVFLWPFFRKVWINLLLKVLVVSATLFFSCHTFIHPCIHNQFSEGSLLYRQCSPLSKGPPWGAEPIFELPFSKPTHYYPSFAAPRRWEPGNGFCLNVRYSLGTCFLFQAEYAMTSAWKICANWQKFISGPDWFLWFNWVWHTVLVF